MKQLTKAVAQEIVGGGKPVYTWIRVKDRGNGHCDYDRYRHEQDKWGNDTGRMYWDGGDGLFCSRGPSFTGTGLY